MRAKSKTQEEKLKKIANNFKDKAIEKIKADNPDHFLKLLEKTKNLLHKIENNFTKKELLTSLQKAKITSEDMPNLPSRTSSPNKQQKISRES